MVGQGQVGLHLLHLVRGNGGEGVLLCVNRVVLQRGKYLAHIQRHGDRAEGFPGGLLGGGHDRADLQALHVGGLHDGAAAVGHMAHAALPVAEHFQAAAFKHIGDGLAGLVVQRLVGLVIGIKNVGQLKHLDRRHKTGEVGGAGGHDINRTLGGAFHTGGNIAQLRIEEAINGNGAVGILVGELGELLQRLTAGAVLRQTGHDGGQRNRGVGSGIVTGISAVGEDQPG